MKHYREYYREKVRFRGVTSYERNMRHMQREFGRYFNDTLNKHTCLLNGKSVELVFQDHSQSNNKDLSDDKYVIAPNETPIESGDYIEWSDAHWLIFTEEFKTIKTHQQAKMKEAKDIIKWLDEDGNVCNNGKGWPSYAQSQTLYTMGVNVTTYIPVVDSKVIMHIQDNPETRSIKMNKRFFVGGRVYKTQYINSIDRKGIISFLMDEDTIGPYDNVDLQIADYYNNENPESGPEEPTGDYAIKGEADPRISRQYTYTAEGFTPTEWLLDFVTAEAPAYISSQDGETVQLRFKDDYRYVGEPVTLMAKAESGQYVSMQLVIATKF